MILTPESSEDLARQIQETPAAIDAVDLSRLRSILEYSPEDMTVTAQCGMPFSELQAALARHRQWVPVDPANSGDLTLGELLARNLHGPRLCGYGPVRDYVIGMRVVLGAGELIHSGGKVVKNVAGYDLCRLFIGARHSLGVIVEVTFKLRPLPETEGIFQKECASLGEVSELAREVRALPFDPVIFDLHQLSDRPVLVIASAGYREDVEAEASQLDRLGISQPATLDYDGQLSHPSRVSLLPSESISWIERTQPGRFVARLGNGLIDYEGGQAPPPPDVPLELTRRIKAAFDPRNLFPPYRP